MERGSSRGVGGGSVTGRLPLALALVAGLALAFSLPAQAATDTLDQSQTLIMGSEITPWMAQTFTAGMTGLLDRVSLATDTSGASGTVQIQSVAGAFPAGTVLGTSSFVGTSFACCHRFHDFVFSPAIPVRTGSQYAIVVKMFGRFHMTWWDSNGMDAYPGGQLYIGCSACTWAPDPKYGGDFAFQTWVLGGAAANQPPVASADLSGVTANEGTAPTNTGTFSDPDGDAVSITASTGTVTQTGTSSGTWSWSGSAADEASTQTVTIKADDGHGLYATTPFTSTLTGVAPTASISFAGAATPAAAAISTAAISRPEGTAVTLNGSASSPSAQDNAAGFTYSWTLTKNGAAFGTGNAAALTFTPDDEGTFVATLQATDDGGMIGRSAVTITGANVAPSARISGITPSALLVVTANESLNFAGSFSDPGALDTHTATWSFGDGATSATSFGPSGSAGLSASHAYAAAGTYTVTLAVSDDDGGVGQATAKVTVQTIQQALTSISAAVQGLSTLNGGQKNSLIAKLNAAGDSASRGNTTAANNQLKAFSNELQADVSTGKISSGDAATLRAALHAVQAAMGTYNRFLDFWPLGA